MIGYFEYRLLVAKEPLFWIWTKKLMEIWYLLITETFLFWTFQEWEIRSFLRLQMKISYLLITEMFLFWTFRGWKIRPLFEAKSWCNDDIYRLLKSFCFELFRYGKYGFFEAKSNGKVIFTDYWKVLVLGYQKVLDLSFLVMGNKVFFSQKDDVKVIFTCSFLAFHDIPGPGKYGFLCSVSLN